MKKLRFLISPVFMGILFVVFCLSYGSGHIY
jgi:hypothetical protein